MKYFKAFQSQNLLVIEHNIFKKKYIFFHSSVSILDLLKYCVHSSLFNRYDMTQAQEMDTKGVRHRDKFWGMVSPDEFLGRCEELSSRVTMTSRSHFPKYVG